MYQHSTHTHKLDTYEYRIGCPLLAQPLPTYHMVFNKFYHRFPTRRFQETLVPSWLSFLPIFWVVPYCAVLKVPKIRGKSCHQIICKSGDFSFKEIGRSQRYTGTSPTSNRRSWSLFNQYEFSMMCKLLHAEGDGYANVWKTFCVFIIFYSNIKSSATVTH